MPTFETIQEEIAGMLSIPDDELTDEQRAAMDAYLDELGKLGSFFASSPPQPMPAKRRHNALPARAEQQKHASIGLRQNIWTLCTAMPFVRSRAMPTPSASVKAMPWPFRLT